MRIGNQLKWGTKLRKWKLETVSYFVRDGCAKRKFEDCRMSSEARRRRDSGLLMTAKHACRLQLPEYIAEIGFVRDKVDSDDSKGHGIFRDFNCCVYNVLAVQHDFPFWTAHG